MIPASTPPTVGTDLPGSPAKPGRLNRRDTRDRLHHLTDTLVLATCADLAGAESWEAIAEHGRADRGLFGGYLALSDGIPSPDTLERVFARLPADKWRQLRDLLARLGHE